MIHDGTPMKVFCDGLIRTCDIYGRQVTFHGIDGTSFELLPILTRPSSVDSLGVLGSLHMQGLRSTRCREDKLRPQYLLLGLDGDAVNGSLARYVRSETSSEQNLLAISVVCMGRTIHNSTLWSLGNFLFGPLLRMAHIVETIRPIRFTAFVDKTLQDAGIMRRNEPFPTVDDVYFADRFPIGKERDAAKVWRSFLERVIGKDGPFSKTRLSNLDSKLDYLVELAVSLYPFGLPRHGELPAVDNLVPDGRFFLFFVVDF